MKLNSVFFFVLCVFSSVCFADAGSELNRIIANYHSLSANFEQKVLDDDGNVIQESSGVMAVQEPGKFYWEIKKPNSVKLICDGKQLWNYDVDLEQVSISPVNNDLAKTPVAILISPSNTLAKHFFVEEKYCAFGKKCFVLKSRDPDSAFESIRMVFKNGLLRQMFLADTMGQTTKLDFFNMQINESLNQAMFHFVPPKGIDVIKN